MSEPLWGFEDLVAAAGGVADGTAPEQPITGFSIDTRALGPGDVFIALESNRDGHDFVSAAFASGAVAALVRDSYSRRDGDGLLIRVDDTQAGLERIGQAARARIGAEAQVVAVTGSVGKTGTKEMLRTALSAFGPTHAAVKSFNNHWGVPLTLARMPEATRFGVFEIGMNHPGEISPLSRMVVPDVAIITTVAPVHLGQFESVAQIADAKAEIFDGLSEGGRALINRDNPYFQQLRDRAAAVGAEVVTFGRHERADVRLVSLDSDAQGSRAEIDVMGEPVALRLNAPGAHLVQNALSVLGTVKLFTCSAGEAVEALGAFQVPEGRGVASRLPFGSGEVVLIDESYNANPASMSAAIAVAGLDRAGVSRRIAVLGDMLELGEQGPQMHRDLRAPLVAAGIDLVFACGPMMRGLYEELPEAMRGDYAEASEGLADGLVARVQPGDLVMIKGSLGSRMQPLVATLKTHLSKND